MSLLLQNGDITDEEAAEVIKQAQVDVARLNKEAWVLNQAVDSVRTPHTSVIDSAANIKEQRQSHARAIAKVLRNSTIEQPG